MRATSLGSLSVIGLGRGKGMFVPRRKRPVSQRVVGSVPLGHPFLEQLEVQRVSNFGVHQDTLHTPLAGVVGARFGWLVGVEVGIAAGVSDIVEELPEAMHESKVVLSSVRWLSSCGKTMVDKH